MDTFFFSGSHPTNATQFIFWTPPETTKKKCSALYSPMTIDKTFLGHFTNLLLSMEFKGPKYRKIDYWLSVQRIFCFRIILMYSCSSRYIIAGLLDQISTLSSWWNLKYSKNGRMRLGFHSENSFIFLNRCCTTLSISPFTLPIIKFSKKKIIQIIYIN